jgi:hypothetical protein
MQKTKRDAARTADKPSLRTRLASVVQRIRRDKWHWFDHPEMQARIAKAEADRREGRVEKFDSREAAFAHLDTLA